MIQPLHFIGSDIIELLRSLLRGVIAAIIASVLLLLITPRFKLIHLSIGGSCHFWSFLLRRSRKAPASKPFTDSEKAQKWVLIVISHGSINRILRGNLVLHWFLGLVALYRLSIVEIVGWPLIIFWIIILLLLANYSCVIVLLILPQSVVITPLLVVSFRNKLFINFNFLILLYITLSILLLLILAPPLEISMMDFDFFGSDSFPNGVTNEIDAFIDDESVNLYLKGGYNLFLSFVFLIALEDLYIETLKLKQSLCLIPFPLGNRFILLRLLVLLFEVLRLQILLYVFFPVFGCFY